MIGIGWTGLYDDREVTDARLVGYYGLDGFMEWQRVGQSKMWSLVNPGQPAAQKLLFCTTPFNCTRHKYYLQFYCKDCQMFDAVPVLYQIMLKWTIHLTVILQYASHVSFIFSAIFKPIKLL